MRSVLGGLRWSGGSVAAMLLAVAISTVSANRTQGALPPPVVIGGGFVIGAGIGLGLDYLTRPTNPPRQCPTNYMTAGGRPIPIGCVSNIGCNSGLGRISNCTGTRICDCKPTAPASSGR